jgi:hypothetical protein
MIRERLWKIGESYDKREIMEEKREIMVEWREI